MNDLIQTIHQSLLSLVANAVQVLPAFILAIAILLLTRYSVRPIKQVAQAAGERIIKSASLQSLLVQMASVATWIAGVLLACILIFPDLGLGDIVALLGLGSVAIGFAFQDIFKNFLAGILLLINEPFRLNDQIIVEGYEGTVEAINVRSTEIRTYQGERIVVPNAMVFTNPVQVLTDLPHRRIDVEIGLDYNTPLPRAIQVLQIAMTDIEGVLSHPPTEIDIVGFGDSSIDFMVRFWCKPQKLHVRHTRTRVILALKKACDEAEFNIPYPIRSVYMFDQQKFDDHYSATPTTNSH